jgi:dihydrofolate reductase
MGKVIVDEWMSLDGVVQAPGAPDEDTTGGFRYGGWHLPYFDEVSQQWVVDGLTGADGYLFGRRSYEILSSYWPKSTSEEERVLAEPLNTKPKYVASRTLSEPLEWQNAHLLRATSPRPWPS